MIDLSRLLRTDVMVQRNSAIIFFNFPLCYLNLTRVITEIWTRLESIKL